VLYGGVIGMLYRGLAGLAEGLGGGLIAGLIFATLCVHVWGGRAVVRHFTLRAVLVSTGRAPWDYARFLDACVDCHLLHRIGGGYAFVHPLLQAYFAAIALPSGCHWAEFCADQV
jgi:hypothetical protein